MTRGTTEKSQTHDARTGRAGRTPSFLGGTPRRLRPGLASPAPSGAHGALPPKVLAAGLGALWRGAASERPTQGAGGLAEAGAGRKEGRPFSKKAKVSVTENFGMFVPEAGRRET